mmetsp:Transcript_53265/g.142545  ORF Transcript_53265/g.142545 Transcript_53265/m.142545 type:complete len:283 (-) Transcript_53265:108-956(-)
MACCADAVQMIRSSMPEFAPKVGIILGSGLGKLADQLKGPNGEGAPVSFRYADLPGFPVSTIQGHLGALLLGTLEGVPVACLSGRCHLYEGHDVRKIRVLVYTLKFLGCNVLFSTAAVGSLRTEVGPGSLVSVTDHINLQGMNPLVGPNDSEAGERFISMVNAYDADLRKGIHKTADDLGITLHDGVYCAALGPVFETPAEIRAMRVMGADVAGMSVVPETIAARHCGLLVATIAVVTNLAAGMSDDPICHEETLKYSALASDDLIRVVSTFVGATFKDAAS